MQLVYFNVNNIKLLLFKYIFYIYLWVPSISIYFNSYVLGMNYPYDTILCHALVDSVEFVSGKLGFEVLFRYELAGWS